MVHPASCPRPLWSPAPCHTATSGRAVRLARMLHPDLCAVWFCLKKLPFAEAGLLALGCLGRFCRPCPSSSRARGSTLLGSAHSSYISSQGVYLQFVLEKVPMDNPGLSGKLKHRFPGTKWGPVTKLSSVTAPIRGGLWTQFLCGHWKIPTACVRKGSPIGTNHFISSLLKG